jgi:hypothetical protein
MKRQLQGLWIILGSIFATLAVLASALAWGPHHCKIAFPMVIGCTMGSYESLAGGMLAAFSALFAGWLAWSAVQVQINAEERRASADRVEIEKVLQLQLDDIAEALSSIWRILLKIDGDEPFPPERLEGVIYGFGEITKEIDVMRTMVTSLGWERRRMYESFLDRLSRLSLFRDKDNFPIHDVLYDVMDVSSYVKALYPATEEYFKGLWERTPKAWSLGYTIAVRAGVGDTYHDDDERTQRRSCTTAARSL